ncbi:MAG: hypothetical protein ABI901_15345, partial [Roseiflexaceae bacterium]
FDMAHPLTTADFRFQIVRYAAANRVQIALLYSPLPVFALEAKTGNEKKKSTVVHDQPSCRITQQSIGQILPLFKLMFSIESIAYIYTL